MPQKVEITLDAAKAVRILFRDIVNVNERAKCSDETFRRHFMSVIKMCNVYDVYHELDKVVLEASKDE